jgi:hypothetical protein
LPLHKLGLPPRAKSCSMRPVTPVTFMSDAFRDVR